MKVFFYRHLPTTYNLKSVFLGRVDLECDQSFIQDNLEKIHHELVTHSFIQLFCSPLKRAQQTARIYYPDKTYIVDNRLIERDLGDWAHLSKNEVKKMYPSAYYESGNLNFNFTPPNGESFSDVINRVSSFLLYLHDNYATDEDIAVITHNGVITAIKCILAGTFSTEKTEFQPFLSEYIVEMNEETIKQIVKMRDLVHQYNPMLNLESYP